MAKTATKPKVAGELEHLDLVHLKGCPSDPDRVESYRVKRPGGEQVQITRCVECGAASNDTGDDHFTEGDV